MYGMQEPSIHDWESKMTGRQGGGKQHKLREGKRTSVCHAVPALRSGQVEGVLEHGGRPAQFRGVQTQSCHLLVGQNLRATVVKTCAWGYLEDALCQMAAAAWGALTS